LSGAAMVQSSRIEDREWKIAILDPLSIYSLGFLAPAPMRI